MKSISELDQDHPRILRDRQQQLAIILDLRFLRGSEREVTDLRQSIDDLGDLSTELGFDVVDGDVGVFDNIVDQSAGDGCRVQLQIHENLGDLDAVGDVLVPRQAFLALVGLLAEPVGARQEVPIESIREAGLQPLGKGVLLRFLLSYSTCRQSSPASAKLM